jgi:ABC-type branched-subunit amino acid transport system substrate-binding protein/outer membrane protein assembly factor BamD (BamD/ComL family)
MQLPGGWKLGGRFAALLVGAALLAACAQESFVLRDGEPVRESEAIEADLRTASAELEAGRPEEAQRVLEGALAELPRSRRTDEVLYLLGEVHLERRDSEAAVRTWERLLDEHPRSRLEPAARLRLARVHREQGRPELAYQVLSEASFWRAEAPLRRRIYRDLADLAREQGDWADSVVWLAYTQRETEDPDAALEVDLEVDEILEARLRPSEFAGLIERLPAGPIRDRALLANARGALDAGDPAEALDLLDRLPRRLRPSEEFERQRLLDLARRGAAAQQNTLGVALPLSGPYAPFGEKVLRGIVLGLGIFDDPPAPYELLVRDTMGDPERAARVVEELAVEGVLAIIGPLRSVGAESAAPVAERTAVPLITLAQREDLAHLGDYVFQFGLTAADQVRTLASYAVEGLGQRRFAILYPRDAYGTSFKNAFWDEVEQRGGEVVGVEGYPVEAVDLQVEIKKLVGLHWLTSEEQELIAERDRLLRYPKENEARLADESFVGLPPIIDFDVLFVPDVASRVGLILPQLRFFDVRDVTLLGTSDWNHPDLIQIGGRDARGAVFTDAFFAGSPYPFVQEFVTRFYAAYGDEPDRLAATGYDAAAILRTILDDARSTTRARLRADLLHVRDFPGVSGLTSFDETGGTRKSLYLLTVKRGAIEQVEP